MGPNVGCRGSHTRGVLTSTRVVTVPNALSALRLASVPVFLWLFASGREEAAVILYGAGALTDFFDGLVARRLGQVSELGKLLDPIADRIFIVALALALVVARALPPWFAIAIVMRDAVLLGAYPWLERRGVGRIPVNFTGKTATACLLLGLPLVALSETDFRLPAATGEVGLVLIGAGTVLYYVAAGLYARTARERLRMLSGTGKGA